MNDVDHSLLEILATEPVATPLNETGTQFAPNTAAQRNYAAAAIVREVRCLSVPAISP